MDEEGGLKAPISKYIIIKYFCKIIKVLVNSNLKKDGKKAMPQGRDKHRKRKGKH